MRRQIVQRSSNESTRDRRERKEFVKSSEKQDQR